MYWHSDGFDFFTVSDDYIAEKIYKFRYRIYIEEMGRKNEFADSIKKKIIDKKDNFSTILYAKKDGDIVGTSRITKHSKYRINLEDFYGIKTYIKNGEEISEGTFLMIEKKYRGTNSTLGKNMLIFGYMNLKKQNIKYDFLNANHYLVDHYRKYGYRIINTKFIHPELEEIVYPIPH